MLRPFVQTLTAIVMSLVPDLAGWPPPGGAGAVRLVVCLALPLAPLLLLVGGSSFRRASPPRWRVALFRRLRLAPLALHAFAIFILGWSGILAVTGLEDVPLLRELALLYPYLVAVSCVEVVTGSLRAWPLAGRSPWWHPVFDRWRRELVVLAPFLVFALLDGLLALEVVRPYAEAIPAVPWLVILPSFGLLGLTFPRLLAWSMNWRPLPRTNEVRVRLEAMLSGLGFVYRDILLWQSRGTVANAAIVGVTGKTRIIVVSDVLLDRLDPAELQAVVAHEVGHGKRHHVPLFVSFALAWLLLLREADGWLGERVLPLDGPLPAGAGLILAAFWLAGLVLGFGVIFGLISRRFELEADLYAARVCGGARPFVEALQRVSLLAGLGRTRRSWRHFSPARRVAFIEQVCGPGGEGARRSFVLRMRAARLAIGVLCSFSLVLFVRSMVAGTLVGLGALAFEKGDWALAAHRVEQGMDAGEDGPAVVRLLVEVYRRAGRLGDARDVVGRHLDGARVKGPAARDLARSLGVLASDLEAGGRPTDAAWVRGVAGRLGAGER